MCASLPGWTPALQSLPGLESKEVNWEAGVYIVYIYIYMYICMYMYVYVCVYIYIFTIRFTETKLTFQRRIHTHRDFSFARWFDTLSKMRLDTVFFAKGFECYRRYRWIVNAKVRFGHLLWHSLRAAFDALLTWTLWTIPASAKGVRDRALDLRYYQRFLDLLGFKGPCETPQLVQAAHDVRTVRWFLRSATQSGVKLLTRIPQ